MNRFMEQFMKSGYKLTRPRRLLLERLEDLDRPFTAEELYEMMNREGIGRATVFRTLKLLLDIGILVRVHLEEGCQHYQLAAGLPGEDHHHDRIICRFCGKITDLDECPMRNDVAAIAKRSGYRLQGHHLDLYGICSRCDADNQKSH